MLGLSRSADSEAVRRVYNRLVRENKGNEEAIARIENAHSTIMMSQLSARMKVHLFPAAPPACMLRGMHVQRNLTGAASSVAHRGACKWTRTSGSRTKRCIFPGGPGMRATHAICPFMLRTALQRLQPVPLQR